MTKRFMYGNKDFHLTWIVLLHYLVKFEDSNLPLLSVGVELALTSLASSGWCCETLLTGLTTSHWQSSWTNLIAVGEVCLVGCKDKARRRSCSQPHSERRPSFWPRRSAVCRAHSSTWRRVSWGEDFRRRQEPAADVDRQRHCVIGWDGATEHGDWTGENPQPHLGSQRIPAKSWVKTIRLVERNCFIHRSFTTLKMWILGQTLIVNWKMFFYYFCRSWFNPLTPIVVVWVQP